MKLAVVLPSLFSIVLARDAKQLSSLNYGGYPYAGLGLAGAYGNPAHAYYAGYAGNQYASQAYGGYPYAGYAGNQYASQAYAGYPYGGLPYGGYPYTMAAPAEVEAEEVVAPAMAYAPAQPISYANAPAYPYAGAPMLPAYAAPAQVAPQYSAGSQFHAQDEFGNLNYGYANINSAKQEVGNTYGGVTGQYSYVDANGKLQKVQYIADDNGFRVADSRLPTAPTFKPEALVAPTFNPDLPVAPVDTPEVAEAKAAHFAAVEAAEAAELALVAEAPVERRKRAAQFSYGVRTYHPTAAYGYAGLPYGAGYATLPQGAGYGGLPHGAGYGLAGLGYGFPYRG